MLPRANTAEADPSEYSADAHLALQRVRLFTIHAALASAAIGVPALTAALARRPTKPRAVAARLTILEAGECPWDLAGTFRPSCNGEETENDSVHTLRLGRSAASPLAYTATRAHDSGDGECFASVGVRRVLLPRDTRNTLLHFDDEEALATSAVVVISLAGIPDASWAQGAGTWVRLLYRLQPALACVPSSTPVIVLWDAFQVTTEQVVRAFCRHLPFDRVEAVCLSAADFVLTCNHRGLDPSGAAKVLPPPHCHTHFMCCVLLCSVVLCCAVLCCVVLCCVVFYSVLFCCVLFCFVLLCCVPLVFSLQTY